MPIDWQMVVDAEPKGYAEFQTPTEVIHGPIRRVFIDEFDSVHVELKWAARMGLPGTPTFGEWKVSPKDRDIAFPNFVVPFEIEDTPEKGKRVRFGVNILYLDTVEGIDPCDVEGLTLPR